MSDSEIPYLPRLTMRLAGGLADYPEAWREAHTGFLVRHQNADGGFAGRDGESDLYYTGFALRGLAVLGGLHGELADRAAAFLRTRLSGRESVVDFVSLLFGAALIESAAGINVFSSADATWRDAVAGTLEDLRRDDGGYAKAMEGAAGSTYNTFLVILCLQLLEREVPEPGRVVDFLMAQHAEEGGFREIRAQKRAGTNPTAAAIATLNILGRMDESLREETADFLAEMQTEDEGGLRANTRIPIADLLSSFTGLLTLEDLREPDAVDRDHLSRFVRSLELEDGGFLGAAWDPQGDVEYTFYGLGCRALLGP